MSHRSDPFPKIFNSKRFISGAALGFSSLLALPACSPAATLCVSQQGKPGCTTTITAAVAASSPGDTIFVHAGIYHEDVIITNSLSLVGEDRDQTIIDATGLPNGIYVNGFDNPALGYGALDRVTVSGFTVRNANFEGILANNLTHLTIFGNTVVHNDQSLRPASGACPGLPAFETSDAADCGEAIHLIGSTHSSVTSNLVQDNAGGILISDESTTAHDILITRNQLENNPYAPGVAIASHPAYFAPDQPQQYGTTYAYGIYDVLVLNNQILHNGFGGLTPAAGVAILAPGSGNRAYANFVTNNHILGNAGAGIVIHTGVGTNAKIDASRNMLVGNIIAGNGPDAVSSSSLPTGISIAGATPIVDSIVNSNSIESESIAVSFNSASTLDAHLNSFNNQHVAVANFNPQGIVQATENWWGCSQGPGTPGCSSIIGGATVYYQPWLQQSFTGDEDGFSSFFAQFVGDSGKNDFGKNELDYNDRF